MQVSIASKATDWPSLLLAFQMRLAANFPGGARLDLRARRAAAGLGAEEVVEVQGLDGVVRLDAVRRGHLTETGGVIRLESVESAPSISGPDQVIVLGCGDDMKHGGRRYIACRQWGSVV